MPENTPDSAPRQVTVAEYGQLLRRYASPYRVKIIFLALLLFTSIGLQLVNPQILRRFIDQAMADSALDKLITLAALFLVIGIANQILQAITSYFSQDVAWSTTNDLRADLVRHCLSLDMTFHKLHTPGSMIERIDGDVNQLANFFSQFVIRVLGSVVLLMGVLILLWQEDWRLGGLMVLFSLINLVVMNQLRNLAIPAVQAERQANADLFGFLEERLAGLEDIKANGALAFTERQLVGWLHDLLIKGRRSWLRSLLVFPATFFTFTVAYALALALGGALYLKGQMSIGTVFLLYSYTQMLLRPLEQLARQIEELQKAGGAITRIRGLLDQESQIRDGVELPPPSGPLRVQVQKVNFAYEDGERVLHGLSFDLQPGRTLGLLGRTGSGKTTIARLLARLYDPEEGQVRIGEMTLPQMQLSALRRRIGVVTQDVQLFRGTVRDNLTLFDPTIPDPRILNVVEQLGLGSWYASLSDGLDTVLEDGGGLSAGEAQLLAFTRIFLRDPGLIILDEASSRLDPATEQLTERAVDRLLHNRTAIIIAHRLTTIERVHDILILENGRILEHGDRISLAGDSTSRFSHLLRTGMEEALV